MLAGHNYFPININLSGKKVLVIGANSAAYPIIEQLTDFGALVEVIAEAVARPIEELTVATGNKIIIKRKSFDDQDLELIKSNAYSLILVDTNHKESTSIANAAKAAGIWVNIINMAWQSEFVLPATIKRGHLKISVSTDGLSLAVEEAIRSQIQ